MADKLVLVTGVSGYVAAHVMQQLQQEGYRVRGTVRSLANEARVAAIKGLAPGAAHEIELVEANLDADDGWAEAVAGCWAVLHTASPFPNIAEVALTDDLVIKPAVEGTTRVLKAAAEAGVKKVVLTSSFASIHGEPTADKDTAYTEQNWTDTDCTDLDLYSKSKTLAEKAAWDLVEALPADQKFSLSVINPTFVMGPPLLASNKSSTSVSFIVNQLNRKMPGVAKFQMYFCDVRDVAKAHVQALTNESAAGQRHIIFSDCLWFKEVATILSDEFSQQGYRVATMPVPYVAVWLLSCITPTLKSMLPRWGQETKICNDRMVKELGITPTPMSQSLIDMAYAIIDMGIVAKAKNYKKLGSRAESAGSTEDKPSE